MTLHRSNSTSRPAGANLGAFIAPWSVGSDRMSVAVIVRHGLGWLFCVTTARARAEAIRLAADLTGGGPAVVLYVLLPHGIWHAIVEIADEHDARAVVGCSHGRSAAASALLGSASDGVANHCQQPVLVAPCSGDHEAATA
jgi:hypothetical protein